MRFALATTASLIVLLAGCGQSGSQREFADVTGTITYQGKALTQGSIYFRPASGEAASGKIGSDGKYHVKGVVGSNKVMISSRESDPWTPDPTKPGAPPKPSAPPKGYMPPKSLIPESYAGPGTPLTFEIKSGTNQKDFDLQDLSSPGK